MPKALRTASSTRLLILGIAVLFGVSVFVHQMYFARRVQAAGFTAGNIVVYRVGDGVAALGSAATAVFLDEYTPAGVLVQSIPMPTTLVGSNRRLTASGTATAEGLLTRSVDGQSLLLTGYDAVLATASISSSSSGTINRVIGRVNTGGVVDTTTALSDGSTGSNPRSATSTDGVNLWFTGGAGGPRFTTLGSTTSTQISTTTTNLRQTNIFGGQLYVSSASGATRLATVGAGTPTTAGQTITNIPGFPATLSPYGFFFADMDPGVAGVDTVYVADDSTIANGGGIQKYSLVGGTWIAKGTISSGSGLRGITGVVSGTSVTLYLSGSGGIFGLTDASGYNANITGTLTTIATVGSNRAFRGIALAPSSGSTNPSGVGAATPASVAAGGSTLLTVTVTPGTVPASTGLAVIADLTSIGGTNNQAFLDDGLNGDAASGDNIFSFNATVDGGTSTGGKTLPFTVSDAQARSGTGNISLTVTGGAPTNPSGTGTASPSSVLPGASSLLTVNVTPGTNPASTGLAVVADLSSIGGSASQSFSGSGNTFTFTATVGNATTPGIKSLPFTITDGQSRSGSGSISMTVHATPPANNVVISQVYGGGGNTGSTLMNDYIELINHSSSPVSLNGWSVQAFVSTTNDWQMTPLPNFTLQPGQYFLVQESQGAGGTDPLPTPDATGTIAVSSSSTKVALVNNTTLITAACPDTGDAGIVDLVGYGGTDCFETAAAPVLTNTTAALRQNEGCMDTDNNARDFVTGEPTPRNSSSPTHDCTTLFGYGSANPSSVLQGASTTLTVQVAPGQNPTSTGITVTADLSSIGGSPTQSLTGGPNTFTTSATVSVGTPPGIKALPVTITDAQARSFGTSIQLSVLSLVPDHITISQVYGGGGNSGATYTNDYVELYNPTAATITITGWSLQYASATGTSWTNKQPIGGYIEPGQYYLVSLASGGAVGAPLPVTPNISGGINMSATAGKIALVKNGNPLSGGCPLGTDPDIVDFVGYGATASCHEGSANAPAPSNTTAIFRQGSPQGSTDADQNGTDFATGAPNPRRTAPIVELGPWVAGTDPSSGGSTVPKDATIIVDFSEPVDVVGTWYNITCVSTGAHTSVTVAHTSDFKTYAITPNVNFQFSEQCTVTIDKNSVHDQDGDDSGPDTDTLFENYVWSFTVVGAGSPAPYPPSVHLTMGNPSNATASLGNPNNFLMEKPTYSISYNRDKGTPNWVSWHLDPSWYGTLARVDTFRADPAVDPTWYRVQGFDYSGSGFDRGHMTPNADRDNQNRIPINQETYLMTNMIPQSPDNNQGPWANFEAELRTITDAGNEVYIVSGPHGVGGVGSASGNTVTTIANGHVTVPASTWKVVLVLSQATGDDISRVTCSSRTIAVLLPNTQGIRNTPWQNFITTVDAIEQLTGYDFYSNLPPAVQACVEGGTNGTNPPGTANQSANTTEDNAVTVTLQALQANNNTLTFSIVNGPTSGLLGSVSPASCLNGTCTATVLYTPAADFNGADSFTFRASDGLTNSNTSTVTISVTEVNDPPVATDDFLSYIPGDSGTRTIPFADLLANDSRGPANEGSQSLTISSVGSAIGGSVSISGTDVLFTPTANFQGTASFKYTAHDNGTSNGSPDPKDSLTQATVSFTVVTSPVISKAFNPSSISQGSTTTLTFKITNPNGSSALTGVGFSDTLPAGLSIGDSSTSPCGGTLTTTAATRTISLSGASVAPGVPCTFSVTVTGSTEGSYTNTTGNVTSSNGGTGNTASANLNVLVHDLTITKTHSGNFSAGQVGATYTITVANIGPGSTNGGTVTVTDNVPVGLTPTGPNGVVNGWTCSITGQTLTCTRNDLLAGNSSYPAINLTVTVANPAPLSVTNTVTVSAGGDVNTNNNTASDPTTIGCSPDFAQNNGGPLMISRFRENGPAGPQDEFIEVHNPTQTPHTVASGNCNGGGYGVYASAGNGTTSNTATLVCYIPNGTVIPAGGYYLCTGVTYSLNNLGRNGGAAGATATGDAPIGCGGTCGANIPDDAGVALMNKAVPTLLGGFGILEFGDVLYDKVGFGPYGPTAPATGYPSQAPNYCEGGAAGCLKPVGDASTGAACANPSGLFPVFPAPPACYGLAGQYELLRRQTTFDANQGTVHLDTNNNWNDFILVAPNPATNMGTALTGVSGVTAVLGAAGPYNRNAPPDTPGVKLTRAPFDGVDQLGPRNAERHFIPDPTIANPANNPVGTFTLRFRYTNNSGIPIDGLRLEVNNLSTLCGPQSPTPASSTLGTAEARNLGSSPDCGTGTLTAILKALNSTAEIMVDSSGTAQNVMGTVLEDLSVGASPGAGPLSPNGGGIDSTLIFNPSNANASLGDGVTGGQGNFATAIGTTDPSKVIRLKIKFGVVRGGRFVLLFVPMAKTAP
jgi:DNA/RNA endonuclease G (NUC1)